MSFKSGLCSVLEGEVIKRRDIYRRKFAPLKSSFINYRQDMSIWDPYEGYQYSPSFYDTETFDGWSLIDAIVLKTYAKVSGKGIKGVFDILCARN